jgi:FtsH-binding integral membrane protein
MLLGLEKILSLIVGAITQFATSFFMKMAEIAVKYPLMFVIFIAIIIFLYYFRNEIVYAYQTCQWLYTNVTEFLRNVHNKCFPPGIEN